MMGMTSNDPANKIYVSYEALKGIISDSADVTETVTDETTGREYETALTESLNATYSFATVEDYETFEKEVYELGLSDSYTVSSADLSSFENSMAPLETLSTTAGYFLLVILGIGAVILIVLNIFSVRERKYEIGVLTAMGMKKQKVALQFLTEIFVVTLSAVIIGAAVGAAASVPVAYEHYFYHLKNLQSMLIYAKICRVYYQNQCFGWFSYFFPFGICRHNLA